MCLPLLVFGVVRGLGALREGSRPSREQVVARMHARELVNELDRLREHERFKPLPLHSLGAHIAAFDGDPPLDPWGRPYVVALGADRLWIDVISYGADGHPGGIGPARDVSGRFGSLHDRPAPSFLALVQSILILGTFALAVGASRGPFWTGALAGAGTACSFLLVVGVRPASVLPLREAGIMLLGVACLGASIALLRHVRAALPVTVVSCLVSYVVLASLLR